MFKPILTEKQFNIFMSIELIGMGLLLACALVLFICKDEERAQAIEQERRCLQYQQQMMQHGQR